MHDAIGHYLGIRNKLLDRNLAEAEESKDDEDSDEDEEVDEEDTVY